MAVNPIQVQKFLSGADYPSDKASLVRHAESQGADEEVCRTLERLPAERFNSANEVSEAIGPIS